VRQTGNLLAARWDASKAAGIGAWREAFKVHRQDNYSTHDTQLASKADQNRVLHIGHVLCYKHNHLPSTVYMLQVSTVQIQPS
jgi:hypothetical protein